MFLQFQPSSHLNCISMGKTNYLLSALFGKVQIVPEPLPSKDLLDREARVAISKRQEEVPAGDQHKRDNEESNPGGEHALTCESLARSDVVPGAGNDLLVFGGGLIDGLRVEDEFEE